MAAGWPDDLRVRFNELFQTKPALDYTDIALRLNAEFKTTLTRSAIAGEVHRKGLHRQPPKANRVHVHHNVSTEAINVRRQAALAREQTKRAVQTAAEESAVALPASLVERIGVIFNGAGKLGLVALAKLDENTCRWPFDCDDGLTRYCGGKPLTTLPYCVEHSGIAFGPRVPEPKPDKVPRPLWR